MPFFSAEKTVTKPFTTQRNSVERVPIVELPKMMNEGAIYVSVPLAILGVYLSSRLALFPGFAA